MTFNEASGTIDWDKLRDTYALEILTDLEDDEAKKLAQVKAESRRRLSSLITPKNEERRTTLLTSDEKHNDSRIMKKKYYYRIKKRTKKKMSSQSVLNNAKQYLVMNNVYAKRKKAKKSGGKSNKKVKKYYKKQTVGYGTKVKILNYHGQNCVDRSSFNAYNNNNNVTSKKSKKKGKGKGYSYYNNNDDGTDDTYYYQRRLKKTKRYSRWNFGLKALMAGKRMKQIKQTNKKYRSPSSQYSQKATTSASNDDTYYSTNYYYGKGKGKKSKSNSYNNSNNQLSVPFCDELNSSSPSLGASAMPSAPIPKKPLRTSRPTPKVQRRTETPVTVPVAPRPTQSIPTPRPTQSPSRNPTKFPSRSPTKFPTKVPTKVPTKFPTKVPTEPQPTREPGIYRYKNGNCPRPGSEDVPCAEDKDLRTICNRYHPKGSFQKCWDLCRDSFCCIHDADPITNQRAPSCSQDENCAQYAYCYIVWFKFHDTFGPATYLNLQQEGNFFDVPNQDVRGNNFGDTFFDQLFFHHFNDMKRVNEDAGYQSGDQDFQYKKVFENFLYWDSDI